MLDFSCAPVNKCDTIERVVRKEKKEKKLFFAQKNLSSHGFRVLQTID
jgi:hypothetical protein